MSVLGRVRYKLGRWKARNNAYGSALGNKAEWTSAYQPPSGQLLITKEAGDDVAAQSENPADREHDAFGTEL